jgi:hypothetical protein
VSFLDTVGLRVLAAPEIVGGATTNAASGTTADEQINKEDSEDDEQLFFEGNGSSNVELALSVLLGVATLLYMPLTIASLGRRAWFKVSVHMPCGARAMCRCGSHKGCLSALPCVTANVGRFQSCALITALHQRDTTLPAQVSNLIQRSPGRLRH